MLTVLININITINDLVYAAKIAGSHKVSPENIIIPNHTRNFIHFAEAFYILKFQPRFEKINA